MSSLLESRHALPTAERVVDVAVPIEVAIAMELWSKRSRWLLQGPALGLGIDAVDAIGIKWKWYLLLS